MAVRRKTPVHWISSPASDIQSLDTADELGPHALSRDNNDKGGNNRQFRAILTSIRGFSTALSTPRHNAESPKFRNVASCAVVAREILRFGWNQPPEHDEERRAAAIAAKMAVGAVRSLWGRIDDAERRRAADLPPLDSFWLNTMLKTRSEREFAKLVEEKNAREREVRLLRKSLSFRLGSLLVAPAGLALAAIRRLSSHRR